ncbi:putative salicylate hydroxylase [Microdochium trichocladiopsis]|uniref:Salicylate hydroxylase n=1 Tax=Microdochium trichocladiopsis TaxID=1682393 RepID=A0A9P8XWH2_9PEZI|nr:putative salicylate hydroxylase [Microdochium trichocladiopsis]KAH7018591.1 putative salicylate hydroxylase [Microdochium trichocladiopsis]
MGSPATPLKDTTIIGAGLAGLTLALALHHEGIPVTVYESRPAPLNIGGAVMLSPNALKIFDAYGLYDVIKTKGYNFEHLEYRTVEGKLVDTYDFGSQAKYGYPGLRIYRYILIDTLVEALAARNIPVVYGKKFSHVVSDTPEDEGVTFALTDGTEHKTSLLIGADGIHSTVRKHLYPDLKTTFIGMAGITAAVPTSALELPADYHLPATIMSPKGAFVIAPQEVDGSEVLIGKQMRVTPHETSGAAWEREFVADKQSGVAFLQSGNEHFPPFVQRAVDQITSTDKVNKWPFFVVPPLERWTSQTRRVLILGDAAHAIPPSAGQGINQAFEDVYMLALLLGQKKRIGEDKLADALAFWQEYRQQRINRIMVLNKEIDQRRMPSNDAVGEAVEERGQGYNLEWLYKPDFKQVVEEWLQKHA